MALRIVGAVDADAIGQADPGAAQRILRIVGVDVDAVGAVVGAD